MPTGQADRMEIEYSFDTAGINWDVIATTLKRVGMAHHPPEIHRRAFEASHTTVFAWHGGQLIGFGRAISDGVYQAAIYDVAVRPEYQGKGVGSIIIKTIQSRLPHCHLILYASPGKEGFYQTLNFRRMKTGMALFQNAAAMAERGFTE
jgi:GNAT superfamily N-acetyltransferase